jgi:hypothetical protein
MDGPSCVGVVLGLGSVFQHRPGPFNDVRQVVGFDLSSPFVDATLSDGSRLHVVIPDITRDHWHVNIRKFVVRADHLEDLVRLGTLSSQAARFLEACVVSGLNILVAGGTQAARNKYAVHVVRSPYPGRVDDVLKLDVTGVLRR